MTVPTSWSSAAFSTSSPIANFDIENSFWNHRCDHIFRNQFTLLDNVGSRISAESCCYMSRSWVQECVSTMALPAWHDPHASARNQDGAVSVGLSPIARL